MAKNIKNLLGKRLQEIRKKQKITQEKLAELVNLDTSSISNIENGKYYPTAENLDKILNVLGISPEDLFSFSHLAELDDMLNEMFNAMKNDEDLTKIMYKFYRTIKY